VYPQDGLLSFFMLQPILSRLAKMKLTGTSSLQMLRLLYSALCTDRRFLPHQSQSAIGYLCEELLAVCLIIGPRLAIKINFNEKGYVKGWVSLESIFTSWESEFGATYRDVPFNDGTAPTPEPPDYSKWECRVYQVTRLEENPKTRAALMTVCHSSAGSMASSEQFSGGDILIPIRRKGSTNNLFSIWSIQIRLNNTEPIGTSQMRDAMWKTHSFPDIQNVHVIRTAVFFSRKGLVQSIGTIQPTKDCPVHSGEWRVVNFDSRALDYSSSKTNKGYLDVALTSLPQDESASAQRLP